MALAIENPGKLDLPPAVELVLKEMFAGYRRVVIRKEFGSSLSGGRVLEVRPIKADGTPELPTVIKVAAISLIQKEWQAYQEHIRHRLPNIAEVIGEPVLLPAIGWAGIRYTLMGGSGTFEVVSLRDYCRRPEVTVDDIYIVVERLLRIMRHLWGYNHPDPEFHFQASYDRVLPVNLLITPPSGGPGGDDPHLVTAGTFPVEPCVPGDLVRLSGFAIKKVDLVNQTVTLNLPETSPNRPSYYVRLKSQSVEKMAAYQVNQIMEPIEGPVIETRTSRLQEEVNNALGQQFDLADQTVRLSEAVSLPNPLKVLSSSLDTVREVNIASIHGDFNLENILIEPETGAVSLIDFSEARKDHILHDFLRLETEVITKLLPAVLAKHGLLKTLGARAEGQIGLLAASLASFYWQLHCAAFGATKYQPALPHPALEKPWAILTTIRQTARNYLFDVEDPTEYYQGLILYLLGALKFSNLDDLPEHPLPKQAALLSAALAYQCLTTPPDDPHAPPPVLADLIDRQPQVTVKPAETNARRVSGPITPEEAVQKLAILPLDVIPTPAPLPVNSWMPFRRNPLFVGRQRDLRVLAKALKGGETIAIGQVETAATTGLGGIGKTQLATEFVHRYGQFFAGGVFWLSFADTNAVPTEIAACGRPGAMDLRPDFGDRPLDEQVRLVLAAWQSPLPRLLVFDNCEDPELLAQWRPVSGGCRILVTSRRADWEAALGVQTLPLDVLPRVESLALLREHQPDVDDATLDAIAEELGDLPLALHLAGSYLARYRQAISPATYLEQLRDPALLRHRSLQGIGISPTHHVQNVNRTFALSYNKLDPDDRTDALALALLTRAACFAPGEPIPYDLLMLTLKLDEDNPDSAFQAEDAVVRLIELGLMRRETDDALRLHRLVVAFVQDVAGAEVETAQEAVETVVIEEAERLNQAGYPAPLLAWQPHLRAVTEAAQVRGDERAARLCDVLGEHLWRVGDYSGARPYWERTVKLCQKVLGEEHPDTARSLNNLGELMQAQGERIEARSYYERALAIQEKILGEEHHDTAATLNNLGYLLQTQGDLVGARPYHERALRVRRKVLGEKHPLIAESLTNLAYLHYAQGNLAEAKPYLEQTLAIQEKVLGEEHPETARSLNHLGELMHAQGNLYGAQEAFEQALKIQQKMLGEEHPETARTLNNLGALLRDQEDFAKARMYLDQALTIRKKVLGEDHPNVASSLDSLGILIQAQGNLVEAQWYYEQALAIRQKVLEKRHFHIGTSFYNLGEILYSQGNLSKAKLYYEQALEIFEARFGANHVKTRLIRNKLALLDIT